MGLMNLPENNPLLEVRGITFAFSNESKALLKNIGFSAAVGETLCVMGPTGCGKSTLLKIMAGLLMPQEGGVWFQGKKVDRSSRNQSQELSRKLSMSFQKGGLLDSLTAAENIDFALRELTEQGPQERHQLVLEALRQVGLADAEAKKPRELSGGMIKRLSLARAIALKPALLLLDEPTAGLDPVTSLGIVDLIRNYQKQTAATLVVITSELSVAFELARKIGLLWEGQLSELLPTEQFKTSSHSAIRQFVRGELSGPLTEVYNA